MKQIAQNYRTGTLDLLDAPVPLCAPGGVLVRTEYSLISPGTELMKVGEAQRLWHVQRADFWLMMLSFASTLLFGLEIGVLVAVAASIAVIVYRLSPLTYTLGRRFVRVNTFGMANLVAGRTIVPELIQDAFTPERVAAETARFLTDEAYSAATRSALAEVKARLGAPGASERAADAVLRVAQGWKNAVRV